MSFPNVSHDLLFRAVSNTHAGLLRQRGANGSKGTINLTRSLTSKKGLNTRRDSGISRPGAGVYWVGKTKTQTIVGADFNKPKTNKSSGKANRKQVRTARGKKAKKASK